MHSDLVYDIGMNNGDDTAHYLSRGFRVVAVEADPRLAAEAVDRFQEPLAAGRLTIVNAVIGPERGRSVFHFSEGNRGVWSSFDPKIAGREGIAVRSEEVECIRFRDLLEQHGSPWYLKVDIEGADRYCLADIDPLDPPQYVSFEISEGRLADIFLLERCGYSRFKLIDQVVGFRAIRPPDLHTPAMARAACREVLKQQVRRVPGWRWARRLLPRRSSGGGRQAHADDGAGAEFRVSTSGPMPDRTAGDWMTVDEVTYAWLYVRSLPNRANWYDIHAAR
jgi:FkbM family methyltransferase